MRTFGLTFWIMAIIAGASRWKSAAAAAAAAVTPCCMNGSVCNCAVPMPANDPACLLQQLDDPTGTVSIKIDVAFARWR
jgi:hypothetical protein